MKECTKCHTSKPFSSFGKDKRKSDGLGSHCKLCRKKYAAKKWAENKDKLLARSKELREQEEVPTHRICRTCKIEKTISSFHKNKSYPGGHIYNCKKCRLSDLKERYENDESFRRARLEKEKKYRENYPERYRKKAQRTYQKNKDSYLANNAKRRAKKLSLDEQVDRAFRRFIKLKFNNTCFNCGSTKKLSLDHHKPLSKGHVLVESNCVLLCRSCNSKKRDKDPENFYTKDQLKTLREVYFVGEIN